MARKRQRQGAPDYRISYLLLALGVLAFGAGAHAAWQGYKTLDWPRAPATIVDVRFTEYQSRDRTLDRPDNWHTVAVRYRYTVAGRERLGTGTEPWDYNMQSASAAKAMQERFPVGASAQVAYDPQDPSVSYLVPGPSSFSLGLIGIGAFFLMADGLARRMIRVGPGDDDERDTPRKPSAAAPRKSPTTESIPPEVASYYPPRQL